MRFSWGKCGLLFLLAVMMFDPTAGAQMTVGENIHLNLSGDASFGYNGVFPNLPSFEDFSSNQFNFAGGAALNGYYYHPNFVSFQVRPYYNQTRLNSNFNSIYGGKGLSASANLFSGSSTPGTIDFERSYNSEEQLNVPGSPGFATNGDSMAFNIGWGFLFKGLPSIHVNYGIANNSADVLGTETRSSGHSRNFGIGAGYSLLGFNLSASYSNLLSAQQVPDFTNFDETRENTTHQDVLTFAASRRLSSWAEFATSYNRAHFTTDFFKGAPTEQTYNTINTDLSMRPLPRLDIHAGMNYASNLSAVFLQSVLPTSAGSSSATQPTTIIPTLGTDSQIYNLRANYRVTNDLNVSGGVQRLDQHFGNADLHGNSANLGVSYGHRLLGGQLGAYYGFGRYSNDTGGVATGGQVRDNSSTTQTAGVSYSHSFAVAGWTGDGRAQYSRSTQTVLLGQVSTSFGGSASLARKLGAGSWGLTLNASASKTNTEGLSNADSLATAFSASLSRRKYGFGGNYSRSNGNSLQTVGGLVPDAGLGPILFPDLLVLYYAESYGFSGTYNPSRRLRISGNYLRSLISTNNRTAVTKALLVRYDIKVVYTFRQLHFSSGYLHLSQGIGATFNIPAEVNAIYFGISRHFDVF